MEVICIPLKTVDAPLKPARKTSRRTVSSFSPRRKTFASHEVHNKTALILASGLTLAALAVTVVYKTMDLPYNGNHTVKMSKEGMFSFDYLNEAMFRMALSNESGFDSNGYIISLSSENEEPIQDYIFMDPVTMTEYVVESGDNISYISSKFGLKNISTLLSVNAISNARELRPGQKLQIPSIDGVFYTVKSGDNIAGLSAKYNVPAEDIIDVNAMTEDTLVPGTRVFIPGATMDFDSLQKAMGEVFISPVKSYRLTSAFGARKDPFSGVDSYHTGIDMASNKGTTIMASMSGTVSKAGWHNVYGNYVIISHVNGYQTLYGHMSKLNVKKGDYVSQGQKIGEMGSTGYSTGNHLHFTVFKNGKLTNPLSLIKRP